MNALSLRVGHGSHNSHYVVRKRDRKFPQSGLTWLAPACGHTVADFEVNDCGHASCRSCQRAARSPRVGPTLLRVGDV